MFSINAEVTPTKEAYEIGIKLANKLLQTHISKHGEYPKKIVYSLWGGEFIRNEGLDDEQKTTPPLQHVLKLFKLLKFRAALAVIFGAICNLSLKP